jgi:Kef-type K+ transport system membrane component KefB
MGLLLDLKGFIADISALGLAVVLVCALISSKFLAAFLAKLSYGYNWQQTLTMWSLSLPQVAATLAAALVGYQEEILNSAVLNSVIFMMLVTAVVGPLITSKSAVQLVPELTSLPKQEEKRSQILATPTQEEFTIPAFLTNSFPKQIYS